MFGKVLAMTGLAAALCLPTCAQEASRFEAGIRGGVGQFGYMDDKLRARGIFGIDGCAFCGGRYALFGGYSRFMAPTVHSGYRSADLVGFGLRIQGRRRISPFFDAGMAVGYSRFVRSGITRTLTTAGAEIGTGVTIMAGRHFYIRPQVRAQIMSELYVGASGQVGIGWRF